MTRLAVEERGMSGSSYNAVTWLLDRNVDEGRGGKTRLHRHRLRTDLWRTAEAKLPRRQHAAPSRRPPRRARRDDHARHGRFSGRVSRRDPRRRRAGAAQHAADLGSIRLCAGGLPRPRAVHLRSAAAGRQGHGRADAGSRACRRLRQGRARPQETVRRTRRRERFLRDRRDPCRRAGVLALFVGLDRHAQGRAASAFQSRGDRGHLCQTGARHSRGRCLPVGGEAVLRLRPRQRADVSDVGRRHHRAQFRAADAGADVRADEQVQSDASSSACRRCSPRC